MTEHCCPEYKDLEKYITCHNCAAPLADNQLVKDAYKMNTVNAWAKNQLKILAEMADDRASEEKPSSMKWFAGEVRRIYEKMVLL